ncbi:vWA domain-containing protein [Planctomycetaceae bacterium SH139]
MRYLWMLAVLVSLACGSQCFTPAASAAQVQLELAATHPTMVAGEKQTNYLRVALTGFEMAAEVERPPINVTIVLDKSGSMQGSKIEQAKQAAIAAVQRLQDQDIVSVVVYDSQVEVLVPATRASDRSAIVEAINRIGANGGTALFAGVSKGAAEVRKFKQADQVNRVILLSDGQANVGPSSTGELAALGESLRKEGISVTTMGLGLGYNEDLMTALASASNGNHAFIESATELVAVFNNEFDDLLSVVATDFEIQVDIDPAARPVRVIGSEADIEGQRITLPLAQLYATQLRNFVIEVEVQPGEVGSSRPLASVSVKYRNLQTETVDQLASTVAVRFTDDKEIAAKDVNGEALAFCTLQLTTEVNREATALRDQGQIEAAKALLEKNSNILLNCKMQCLDGLSPEAVKALDFGILNNRFQAQNVSDSGNWNFNRKLMRQYQNSVEQQQTYSGVGKISETPPADVKPKQSVDSGQK